MGRHWGGDWRNGCDVDASALLEEGGDMTIQATLVRVRLSYPDGPTEDRWCVPERPGERFDIRDESGKKTDVYAYRDAVHGKLYAPRCCTEIREGLIEIRAVEVKE